MAEAAAPSDSLFFGGRHVQIYLLTYILHYSASTLVASSKWVNIHAGTLTDSGSKVAYTTAVADLWSKSAD